MALGTEPGRPRSRRDQEAPRPQTATQRGWRALNLTDTRLSLEDDELAWLENGMWLGRSIQSVPLYNGAAGNALHASLVKESFGCQLTYGAFTVPHPVSIVVFEDGAAYQRDHYLDGAVDTLIAGPGTFSASPNGTGITIWQDGPVLFLDDTIGYLSWNGVTLTVIDATRRGHHLAVFEGHVWLQTAARTITYTAPNTFNDFTAGNGAGSFRITDDAFEGQVFALHSTVEQLWILGASAIDALGNVATAGGVTTFAVTNALTSLGSSFGDSVIGYFRALAFATGYSIHSLLGVTPQKLSAKLDRLFSALGPTITFGPRAGIAELNGALVLCFLYQFTDPVTALARSELLGFVEGRWFLCTTPDLGGNRVMDLVTLTIGTIPELYGIDQGGFLYRLFARAGDPVKGTMTVRSKLYDLGTPIEGHQALRVGFDLSAPSGTAVVATTITLTSEAAQVQLGTDQVALLTVSDSPLGRRYALHRRDAPIIGQRLGWTITMPCTTGVCLEGAHLQYGPTGEWDTVASQASVFSFTTPSGVFIWLT